MKLARLDGSGSLLERVTLLEHVVRNLRILATGLTVIAIVAIVLWLVYLRAL